MRKRITQECALNTLSRREEGTRGAAPEEEDMDTFILNIGVGAAGGARDKRQDPCSNNTPQHLPQVV